MPAAAMQDTGIDGVAPVVEATQTTFWEKNEGYAGRDCSLPPAGAILWASKDQSVHLSTNKDRFEAAFGAKGVR